MSVHTHVHVCTHILHHCPVCDVVYCSKCGDEWKKTTYQWYTPYYSTTITSTNQTQSHTHEKTP